MALLAYSLYIWADRLLLSGYPERQDNWPLIAVLNIVILAWSLWVLTRPKAMAYFGEKHEQKPKITDNCLTCALKASLAEVQRASKRSTSAAG